MEPDSLENLPGAHFSHPTPNVPGGVCLLLLLLLVVVVVILL